MNAIYRGAGIGFYKSTFQCEHALRGAIHYGEIRFG